MVHRIRTIAYGAVGALALWTPSSAFALEFIGEEYQDQIEETGLTTSADPVDITLNIINIVFGLLALISVVLVLIGGFIWMTSGGNVEKIKKAKKLLISALIGLFIIMAAYGVTNYVFEAIWFATGGVTGD